MADKNPETTIAQKDAARVADLAALFLTVQNDQAARLTASQGYLAALANLQTAQTAFNMAEMSLVIATNQLIIDETALFGAVVAVLSGG